MTPLPEIHLSIVQPPGYVHSLGFLDPARYFRHQFRRMGAHVTIGKNRLRHDAVNLVFGAHLGFDPALRERHACIFVNLEQLGPGGAQVTQAYRDLLASSAVVDYDADNVPAYARDASDVPVVPLLHAPYLAPQQGEAPPLEDRPIDLLFIGSLNERRKIMLARIEALGLQVALFDSPLYGAERDAYIRQAKAVLNMHFYATSRFEQARVSHCLSLGTPVISERGAATRPHPAFEESVDWFREDTIEACFRDGFGTPAFFTRARAQLANFEIFDPIEAYADLLAFTAGFGGAHHERRPAQAWRPRRINLGSGKDYKPGWLNLDVLERAEPDLLLDLGRAQEFPLERRSASGEAVRLEAGSVEVIHANNVLEHVPDLPQLMGNCLALLATGGTLEIEVPYEKAPTAWQDPTHLRALNENSWVYYTDWFWYLGWFEHRFEIVHSTWLDLQLKPCGKEQAAFMRVHLRKIETTPRERMTARTMRPDFGGIEDDEMSSAPPATLQAVAA
jgi:SAM-dependent methyltransferase